MKQIISAAITPFYDDGRIDLDSASRLYEFNLANGCDGFFILGSMGEWALLTPEEKNALAKCACDTIGSKAKVLLGIADTGLANIFRNMEDLSSLSHSHWVLVPPGNWAGPSEPVSYVHKIADKADRPMYLYYIPGFNGVTITTAQFKDILAHPNVVGLKNSSGSIRTRKELLFLKQSMDFDLFEGEEWGIDEALIAGCDGAVAGFASTATKLMKEIARLVDAKDFDGAIKAQFTLVDIFHKVYGEDVAWWNIGQKYALQYMGIISSIKSRIESQQDLPEEQKAVIRACIDSYRDRLM
ncbi:dihydrodipicolinate synthase family protein [bacterium]|nr:dihydrodipicolinate synthase family protein [bacterium]